MGLGFGKVVGKRDHGIKVGLIREGQGAGWAVGAGARGKNGFSATTI